MARDERPAPAELPGWPDPEALAGLPDRSQARAAVLLARTVAGLRATGATAVALADMAGVNERTVRRILTGQVWPDLEILLRLASTHGIGLGADRAAGTPVVRRRRTEFTACRPCRLALAEEFPQIAAEMNASTGRDRAVELMRMLPPVPVLVVLRSEHDTDMSDQPEQLSRRFRGDEWFVEIRHHAEGVFAADCDLTQYAFGQFNLSDLSWMERLKGRTEWPPHDRWWFREVPEDEWTDEMLEHLTVHGSEFSLYPDDEW